MQVSNWSRFEKAIAIWALAIASVALLVVLVAMGSAVSDNSSNVASWVQAVGSIAAIIAGFRVARFSIEEQHARQAAKDDELARQLARKCCFLVLDRYTQITGWVTSSLQGIAAGAIHWPLAANGCSNILSRMGTLSAADYPDPLIVLDVTNLRVQLEIVLYTIQADLQIRANTKRERDIRVMLEKIQADTKRLADEMMENIRRISTVAESNQIAEYSGARAETRHIQSFL